MVMVLASLPLVVMLAGSSSMQPAPMQSVQQPAQQSNRQPAVPSGAQSSTGPLAGGLFSAGQLRQRCLSNVSADASYCFAYITGVHDTVRAYEAWLNQREFCVPRHVPQGDLRQAFLDYLRDKPSDLSGEAASVVVVALKIRYACTAISRAGAASSTAPALVSPPASAHKR
jgi:hypothetical protein